MCNIYRCKGLIQKLPLNISKGFFLFGSKIIIGAETTSGMSSQPNDPRQSSAARPYKPSPVAPQDLPIDYSGFIAVIFGVFGAMFRYKVCSWLAIIFSAQSLANMRNMENDLKQISMAMMFGIMGLMTNYLGVGPRASKKT